MCQYNNILKNTGDTEKTVFKLLIPGNTQDYWITPYAQEKLKTGIQYDAGKRDIHYSKKRKLIDKGYFHCYETYEEARRCQQDTFYSGSCLCLIVKCTIPKNTAYYEGNWDYYASKYKTLATRSIIVNEPIIYRRNF